MSDEAIARINLAARARSGGGLRLGRGGRAG
jgi:hypothetical protein